MAFLKSQRYTTKGTRSRQFKLAQIGLIACCALLPWNATAVNKPSMSDKILSKSFGRDLVEGLLVKSLMEITEGNMRQAMSTVDELIRTAPNFKLAYLIRGDLLSAQANELKGFGNTGIDANNASADKVQGLRDEAKTRIEHYFSADNDKLVPKLMVELDKTQTHLILVDTVKSRLFLYKNTENGLVHVADYYVTIGKNGTDKLTSGDKRTPLGLYFAGKKLNGPLDDIYGDAAFPLSYPNELDQKQGRTGSGIWIHGTPHDTYSRPPRASDGCVVLSNPDLKAIMPILELGNTPVVISNHIEWIDSQAAKDEELQKKALVKAMMDWRADWATQDSDAYLSHYSKNFFYSDGDLSKWASYKRSIQASKPKVSISIDDITMLSYPDTKTPTVVVNFTQDFKSNALQNKMRKRQYWQLENNEWKIIYEGSA